MKILLVANESAGLQAAKKILQSSHSLTAVLTEVEMASGSAISTMAKQAGCRTLPASSVSDPRFSQWISRHQVDVLLNVHSLHRIDTDVIQSLNIGAFNLHPGPLPRYAGLNAPSWAIYNREESHAVTLHEITPVIDAGDILYEHVFPLGENDTGLSVSLSCTRYGIRLIEQFLQDLSNDSQVPTRKVQDLSQRRVYKRSDIPNSGKIVWDSTAREIDAFVRASSYSPFPSPWGVPHTSVRNHSLSILKMEISSIPADHAPGTVGAIDNRTISVAAADRWVTLSSWLLDGKLASPDTFIHSGDRLS
ncbi:MAG: methionyl-tRNA formyltransferase [Bacteroidota bacterium]